MRRNIARDELGTQELDRKWIRVVAVRRRHRQTNNDARAIVKGLRKTGTSSDVPSSTFLLED